MMFLNQTIGVSIIIKSVPCITLLCAMCACQGNFDDRLEKEAKAFTADNCPQEVEAGTLLDSLTYDKQQRIYTLHYSVNATNEAALREKANLMHQLLLNNLRNDVSYKDVKDQGVTFRYIYRSKENRTTVYTTDIPSTEYTSR